MLGVSRRAGNWLAAVALVGAAVGLAMVACAAVVPAGAPGKGPDGKAIHATPAPQYYPIAPYLPIPHSIPLTTYSADVVAHVKLKSVRGGVEKSDRSSTYWPAVWYEFEAIEYLKGSGGDTIWGLVFVEHGAQSEEAAQELAARYVQLIDPLHTGEAVVFMKETFDYLPSTRLKDHYHLGRFYIDWFIDVEATNPREDYSLAGLRHWLPLAASDGVSGAGEEAQFMLRHPNGNYAEYYPEDRSFPPEEVLNAAGAPVTSVIGLSDLRYIAKNERRLLDQQYQNDTDAARRVGMAAQNLTAEVVGDAIVLRWDVGTSPSGLGGVKGYRVFRQASVEGRPGFSAPGQVESELVKLGDVGAGSASMSYEDRVGVSPGATYIYRVWTLEEDVYVFGEYGAEARVGIVAGEGAKAVGAVAPVPVYY